MSDLAQDRLNLSIKQGRHLDDVEPDLPRGKCYVRHQAVQLIYWLIIDDTQPYEDLLQPADGGFVFKLVKYVMDNRDELEQQISRCLSRGTLDEVAVVDRCIMLAALAEIVTAKSTPVAVIINDAVEIAKILSSEKSASFINGVLRNHQTQLS